MAASNHFKLFFLIYLQFCNGIDDIAENFEMVSAPEIENAMTPNFTSVLSTNETSIKKEITNTTEFTSTNEITTKNKGSESNESDIRTTAPISKPTTTRTTLQSILKKKRPVKPAPKNTTQSTALCPYFIYSAGFRMERMPDVWQPVYYKMGEKLKCFKIQIKKTSKEDRRQYEQDYGNFNGTVDWSECHFEIKSSSAKDRKHFLQGGVADMGVMRNIIIVQDDNDEYILKDESPDQWLMVKELLLIRDCDSGGTVVFARVPLRPRTTHVRDVLEELGEEMTGSFLCEDSE